MKSADEKRSNDPTDTPAKPRKPQREDQPLKKMNEDPDEAEDDQNGLPPDSGKFEGTDPVPRESESGKENS